MATIQIYTNSKYAWGVEYSVSQNTAALTSTVTVTRLYCTSLTQYHSFYGTGNITGGIGVNSNYGTTSGLSMTVNIGQTGWLDLADRSDTIAHNSTTGKATATLRVYLDAGLGGEYTSPVGGWYTTTINLPTITPPTPDPEDPEEPEVEEVVLPIKVDGVWKSGKTYYKTNGEWREAKSMYIKLGKVWKQHKNN